MFRTVPLLVAGLLGATGCKGPFKLADVAGGTTPGLLVGPQAAAEAPPPVELPVKEATQLCLRTAQEYEKGGDVEGAIRLYEKARGMDPKCAAAASRRLAALYDKAGDFSKSAAEYETLLKARPKDADLLNDVGYSHYSRGDWATAEQYLARAVQADPNHKRAWTNLGLAQGQQGKFDDAFQSFCRAVRPADAHCNLAFVLAAQGRTEEAKDQYRRALALDPSQRVARSVLTLMENPIPPGERPSAKKEKRDPLEAAATVPSIGEIEARIKKDVIGAPVVLPAVRERVEPDHNVFTPITP